MNSKCLKTIDAENYFLERRTFSNVEIRLANRTVWCDKAALAAASPVLCSMFAKENNENEELSFEQIEFEDFLVFLQFIYPIFNPEINQENVTALIELSDRFKFDVLREACQIYVVKYLQTIRHVTNKSHQFQPEGDFPFNDNDQTKERDLIEFNDGICVNAKEILVRLCRWLSVYLHANQSSMIQSIISIVEQISVDGLEQSINAANVDDTVRAFIYKSRAQYVEEIYQMKRIA